VHACHLSTCIIRGRIRGVQSILGSHAVLHSRDNKHVLPACYCGPRVSGYLLCLLL
jgi:hypothetical protein